MLKIYSSWLVAPEAALTIVRDHLAHHSARLARYQEIATGMERD